MTRTNPKVNRSLKDKHFDHIDHALGRPVDPLRESSRNYFATYSAEAAVKSASPHWVNHGARFGSTSLSVSQEGREALARHLKEVGESTRLFVVKYWPGWADQAGFDYIPAKTHSKARYQSYLDYSDCDDDLTFREFQKHSSVKLYRHEEVEPIA